MNAAAFERFAFARERVFAVGIKFGCRAIKRQRDVDAGRVAGRARSLP